MTLLNAPAYDVRRANRIRNALLGLLILFFLLIILSFVGYVMGHGWLFTNLATEHRVNKFFLALEAKDYPTAYGIYYNDADWQKTPAKYSGYPIARFAEDWTTYSPVKAPITSHHVDISKTDGKGAFGTGVIVATRVNGNHKVFMYVSKSDGQMTWPAPHVLQYGDEP